MTPVKAKLSVILKADEVIVAEVEDAKLWQQVLNAVNSGKSELKADADAEGKKDAESEGGAQNGDKGSQASTLDSFAQQFSIAPALIEGACSPSATPPYLHLDSHCWEEMKKQLPQRGPLAVAPIVAAATLLALWFKKAGLGNPTQAQAKVVLATISIDDPNASRSIKNTSWLQGRAGGQIVINPAEVSKAVKLGKCFCSKDWSAWKEAAK